LITIQENRVKRLETDLTEAREKLRISQEIYITTYISKTWHGKDFAACIKAGEEAFK
jgi:hypothetical protein